jgi:multidrug efflux pump subunit AcrA (membrane-fusion protein)
MEDKNTLFAGENEAQLRAEIDDLRRQLEAQKRAGGVPARTPAQPSRRTLTTIALIGLGVVIAAFFAGYIPRQKRESLLSAEAKARIDALPAVSVVKAVRSSSTNELTLPGSIQAITEAPVLARASGYIKRRYADIGDRVAAGSLLAEIEAPELDQQVEQARASLDQTQSALEQALANLEQGKTNQELARVTAVRFGDLVKQGVVSQQEDDQYQAQYKAQISSVQSLEKAVSSARNNVSAAKANLARLAEMKGYEQVKAPFAGVITLRNVDVGTLIGTGSTLLFRIAQTGTLRTYVNVPQAEAATVRPGQTARLTISDLPDRQFLGKVTRTANSLDPATRTLLAEVQVPNVDGRLMPGMYAQVMLSAPRESPPLLIPGDALVVRADGTQVATVDGGHKVHFQRIRVGRDYGDKVEVISGLQDGQQVIVNPGDSAHEGAEVNPIQTPRSRQ